MKTFIISSIIFFLIILFIVFYIIFLNVTINEMNIELEKIIITAKDENWNKNKDLLNLFDNQWKNKKKIFESFVYHNKTDKIGDLISELKLYNEFKNKNQIILKAQALKLLLTYIYDDEIPTPENII